MDFIALLSIFVIAYAYFGYPALLMIWPKRKTAFRKSPRFDPAVSILIAAFNEEKDIEKTILALLKSNYPADKLEIIISSDASTDRTDEIVRSFSDNNVKLYRLENRGGKFEAQRNAIKCSTGDIIVLADASGEFDPDAINKLIRHFENKDVGSSVGRKIIGNTDGSAGQGEGLYWRYESKLRHLESLAGSSMVGCEGGISAIRKELLSFDYNSWIAQDYALCCRIYEKGFRNIYEPEAVVYEKPTRNMHLEFSRKIRVIVRGIQAFFAFRHLLNPLKHGMFFFQNVSHRLLRWLVPFFLILLFVSSGISENIFLKVLFFGQIVFYLSALIGGLIIFFRGDNRVGRFLAIPLYFSAMNLSAMVSWGLLFKKFGIWKRTERN